MDVVISSTDKNLLVPVGGAIAAGPDKSLIQAIGKVYPGRASAAPAMDLFCTLLHMGVSGYVLCCVPCCGVLGAGSKACFHFEVPASCHEQNRGRGASPRMRLIGRSSYMHNATLCKACMPVQHQRTHQMEVTWCVCTLVVVCVHPQCNSMLMCCCCNDVPTHGTM